MPARANVASFDFCIISNENDILVLYHTFCKLTYTTKYCSVQTVSSSYFLLFLQEVAMFTASVKPPTEEELERLMSGDIDWFVEELNAYTPCVTILGSKKQEANYRKLRSLIVKILNTSKFYFKAGRQQRKIIEAIRYSAFSHKGIYRKDGFTPYLLHPLEVACILIDIGVHDFKVIVSAILHDVVEDTDATHSDVGKRFGAGTKNIVHLMTRDDKEDDSVGHSQYYFLMKTEPDLNCKWRVILIKFTDRIHYFKTCRSIPPASRRVKAEETLLEFPELHNALAKTLFRLYEKGTLKNKKHLLLPFVLNNLLHKEMERYL